MERSTSLERFRSFWLSPSLSASAAAEATTLREDLLDYCERDTYAMIVIHEKLAGLVDSQLASLRRQC